MSDKQFSDMQQEMKNVDGFADFQKINEYLFIGNQISAMQKSRLAEAGITQVLKVNGIPSMFIPGV